jgi:hypothetical protein
VGFTFHPLLNDGPVISQPDANHRPLFAFIIQQTSADFECHAFACQRETDAIRLVRLFTKMAAPKNRGSQSESEDDETDCCSSMFDCGNCDCDCDCCDGCDCSDD